MFFLTKSKTSLLPNILWESDNIPTNKLLPTSLPEQPSSLYTLLLPWKQVEHLGLVTLWIHITGLLQKLSKQIFPWVLNRWLSLQASVQLTQSSDHCGSAAPPVQGQHEVGRLGKWRLLPLWTIHLQKKQSKIQCAVTSCSANSSKSDFLLKQ